MVSVSPWPLLTSMSAFLLVIGLLSGLSNSGYALFYSGTTLLLISACLWWVSVTREATLQGYHTAKVQASLRLGISLLIISEAFFFLGFFWAYLHSSLSPAVEIGSLWPPAGITPLLACSVPLLNTCVLLVSAACVTFSHHSLILGLSSSSQLGLSWAVLLGIFFTTLQAQEYYSCSFSIADSVYGSCFFLATGFHGLHVIAGTLWLFVNLLRLAASHFSSRRHLGLEFSIWYWHFVDVIWLLLFLVIYCWGS